LEGDFVDSQAGNAQKLLGAIDTKFDDIIVWAHIRMFFKDSGKVKATDM
jgi:hypothetical protein